MGSVWCTLHMEDSSFQRKSVILVVPALLPLQPSQSSPSSETCQLISYRSKGFADSHCHAALFLRRSRMHGSNTGGKLTCAPGLHKFLFSRERGFLQRKRWDLVTEMSVLWMPFLSLRSSPALPTHCASPRSATDCCCFFFFPQSWISAGCRRTRAPAGTLCWSGTTTPRPRAAPASGTVAVAAMRTGSTRRKNVKNSACLVRGAQPNSWHELPHLSALSIPHQNLIYGFFLHQVPSTPAWWQR